MIVLLVIQGCSPYTVNQYITPPGVSYDQFQAFVKESGQKEQVAYQYWWQEFEDPKLNQLMQQAFSENLSLQAAWARLKAAREQADISGASLIPQISLGINGSDIKIEQNSANQSLPPTLGGGAASQGFFTGGQASENYSLTPSLSYEFDIWNRVRSGYRAGLFRAKASQADFENTALILSGNIVELWFVAKEQKALIDLIAKQIHTSEQLVELTKLRFSISRASALDLFQQKEQLASIESQLPIAQSSFETTLNQLAILLGQPPGYLTNVPNLQPDTPLPKLPIFPSFFKPVDLLEARPDLKAEQLRLNASEYDIASAVADRFPRLTASLSYSFNTTELGSLFLTELFNAVGSASVPLLDGDRRRSQVRLNQAVRDERLATYTQSVLSAFADVENAVITEKYRKQFFEKLEQQATYSKATFTQAKHRYINGQNDYLQVIIALQNYQAVQRRLVAEQRELLIARTRLYRSLGRYSPNKDSLQIRFENNREMQDAS